MEVSLGKRRRGITAGASSSEGADNVAKTSMIAGSAETSFNFPYYLSEMTKHELIASYFLHMRSKIPANKPKVPRTHHRVLLLGPKGSETYQERLVMSLAHHFRAKLLVFDCHLNHNDLDSLVPYSSKYALRFDLKQLRDIMGTPTLVSASEKAKIKKPKIGERVVYTGLKSIDHKNMASRGPTFGSCGIVKSSEKKTKKVGVRFDTPIPNGVDLEGLCEADQGYICDANEFCIDVDDQFNPLFAPFQGFNMEGRIIVFMKHAASFMVKHGENYLGVGPSNLANRLPDDIFLIVSHTKMELKGKFNGVVQMEPDFPKSVVAFFNTFKDIISIQMPEDKKLFDELKSQFDRDVELLKAKENISRLEQAVIQHGLKCEVINSLNLNGLNLTKENADKVVKWALGRELRICPPTNRSTKIVLSEESVLRGLDNLRNKQITSPTPNGITPSNEYERRVLEEVVLHTEVGVKFDDIGALDNIKDLIREIVILPLQRPDIFLKGKLRKPCKGILLFGPSGTGKTMLAKAVATEACATFFNISISNLVSKWFGEAENVVKAIFSLARKLAPSVLFIDEVDAVFGKTLHEHEQTRKTRNEFLVHWDGLLSKDTDRVLVLAATNRPYDLDDAVIRRMPRRFMVDLPDVTNRSEILKVILAGEEMSDDVDINAIARMTDLFSGSDLNQLCRNAAQIPVREFLKKNKGKSPAETPEGEIRPLSKQDFKDARSHMKASVSSVKAELRKWNELYGSIS